MYDNLTRTNLEFAHREAEKRIAELEIQLANSEHDREHNDYELTEVYKKVTELEKENAELQYKVDTLQGFFDHDIEYDMDKKIQELKKENALLKGRNEGFEQQIMGLLIKYEEYYKRFPDLKGAMNEALNLQKENTELKNLVRGMLYEINQIWDIEEMDPDVRKCAEKIEREAFLSSSQKNK